MHLIQSAATAVLVVGGLMQPVFAQSAPSPQHPGDAGYDALLAAATAPVRDALGTTVVVEVERLDRLGRWAFLQGTLRSPGGGRPDYAETSFAERAAQGGMSDVYVALLQAPGEAGAEAIDTSGEAGKAHTSQSAADGVPDWKIIDYSIGPSDVSWLGWPAQHAAPRQLFGF